MYMPKIVKHIEIKRQIPIDEFIGMLRSVSLNQLDENEREIKVYQNAHINYQRVNPMAVNPPQFYILKNQLQVQKDLHYLLNKKEIDIFNLENALLIVNDKGEEWIYNPPIVEITPREISFSAQHDEIDYRGQFEKLSIPVWMDGAHRAYNAILNKQEIKAIVISKGFEENPLMEMYPYYAHPNSWDNVAIYESVPEFKKRYTKKQTYNLFRNLEPLGCGKPRKIGSSYN